MNAEDVYELLVSANPVPDLEALPTRSPAATLRHHEQGSEPMNIVLDESRRTGRSPRRSRRRWLIAAAAVAAIAVAAVVALAAARSDDPDGQVPADEPVPTPTREERAVVTALAFHEALIAGDVDAVISMSNPAYTDLELDRHMWEMNAVFIAEGETRTIESCEPGTSTKLYVDVDCTIRTDEPVMNALGVRSMVFPVQVFDEGGVVWRLIDDRPYILYNAAYADYLRTFHRGRYDDACAPEAYEPGSVRKDRGLALTAECAELAAPLAQDVARWIADGRPTP